MPLACLFRDLVPTAHLRPPVRQGFPRLLMQRNSRSALAEVPPRRPAGTAGKSPAPLSPANESGTGGRPIPRGGRLSVSHSISGRAALTLLEQPSIEAGNILQVLFINRHPPERQ